jgi:hypothetical protein
MYTYNTAKYIETENKIVNVEISPNILEKYGKTYIKVERLV